MARGNQHLPIPPAEGLDHWIQVYWKLGFNDKLIASHVIDHFDKNLYGISAKTVSRRHTNLGLLGTRQRSKVFSLEELMPLYEEIRRRYPAMGGRGMVTQLRLHYDLKVSEKYLLDLFQVVEPEACWTFLFPTSSMGSFLPLFLPVDHNKSRQLDRSGNCQSVGNRPVHG
ncbi:hypothetical protein C8J56DRAFT_527864 [Mycena floridula]|nr:hypothetical protein C8J56DRAFT_527864 [Mycena floridula]